MTNRPVLIDAHLTLHQMKRFGIPGPYRLLVPLHYAQAVVDEMRESGIDMNDPYYGATVDLEFSDGDQVSMEVVETYRG